MTGKGGKHNKYAGMTEPQATLDFHGYGVLNAADVKQMLDDFLEESASKGLKRLLVVTGKGLHSAGGEAKVKQWAQAHLRHHALVKQCRQSRRDRGGSGALELEIF